MLIIESTLEFLQLIRNKVIETKLKGNRGNFWSVWFARAQYCLTSPSSLPQSDNQREDGEINSRDSLSLTCWSARWCIDRWWYISDHRTQQYSTEEWIYILEWAVIWCECWEMPFPITGKCYWGKLEGNVTYRVVKGPPNVNPYEIHLRRRTLHLNLFEEEIANYQGCAVCPCLEQ